MKRIYNLKRIIILLIPCMLFSGIAFSAESFDRFDQYLKNISGADYSAYVGTKVYVFKDVNELLVSGELSSPFAALKTVVAAQQEENRASANLSQSAEEDPPIYYEIEVELPDEEAKEAILNSGVDLDHFHPEDGTNTIVIPASEIELLKASGLTYTITSFDLARDIEQRNIADLKKYNPAANSQQKTTAGFELGSMGGFYTFAEIVQQLDEMASLYPSLITPKFSIGTTAQGRTIWAVKISDNPSVDESAGEAAVYIDALHHAREPASMATVINFMFHLLENYNTSPQLGYLVARFLNVRAFSFL